ncbi:MAG: MoaD/ThiS family protein [Chloroflexi bacterium]|nr:MoaD/ThiS family protein [Chloroflexota bacterium]
MSIKIEIPSYWLPLTNNLAVVEVSGSTVGECLNHLVEQFSGIAKMLFDKDGKLFGDLGIYVNGADTYPQGLAKPVKDGDRLYIPYIIAGG